MIMLHWLKCTCKSQKRWSEITNKKWKFARKFLVGWDKVEVRCLCGFALNEVNKIGHMYSHTANTFVQCTRVTSKRRNNTSLLCLHSDVFGSSAHFSHSINRHSRFHSAELIAWIRWFWMCTNVRSCILVYRVQYIECSIPRNFIAGNSSVFFALPMPLAYVIISKSFVQSTTFFFQVRQTN